MSGYFQLEFQVKQSKKVFSFSTASDCEKNFSLRKLENQTIVLRNMFNRHRRHLKLLLRFLLIITMSIEFLIMGTDCNNQATLNLLSSMTLQLCNYFHIICSS